MDGSGKVKGNMPLEDAAEGRDIEASTSGKIAKRKFLCLEMFYKPLGIIQRAVKGRMI